MQHPDPSPPSCESPLPERLLLQLAATCPSCLPAPTWQNVLLLVAGAILAPGKRTVTAALRILGAAAGDRFPNLSWCAQQGCMVVPRRRRLAARCLLVDTFLRADAAVVIGIDDTIERRWGGRKSARAASTAIRSVLRRGHFVKTSGLRWLSAQLLVHIPWVGRIMGLPFLTVLAPSKRFYADKPRSPKTLLDWARQVALQIHTLAARPPDIVIVGDTAFAAVDFLGAVRNYVSVVTRIAPRTPISMPPHHPDDRAADDRRSRASACPH